MIKIKKNVHDCLNNQVKENNEAIDTILNDLKIARHVFKTKLDQALTGQGKSDLSMY